MKKNSNKGRVRHLRDFVAVVWIIMAAAVVVGRSYFTAYEWLAIHILFLGALTHSAMVWSEYFSHTLLKSRASDRDNFTQDCRIIMLAIGASLVFIGFPAGLWILVAIGATFVGVAIIWHVVYILMKVRVALPGRFRIVLRYYEIAGLMLPCGATVGIILAIGVGDEWRGKLMIAHMTFNFLGWIGLTVIGTLVTFWPTLLRARMHEKSELWVKQALLPLSLGVIIIVTGALFGSRVFALLGLIIYALGIFWWGRALLSPIRNKGVREYAPAAVGIASLWAMVGLMMVAWSLASSSSWSTVTEHLPRVGIVLAAGFAIQILTGALSFLIPSLIGNGSATVRAVQSKLNTAATFRTITPNAALLMWLLPIPSGVQSSLIGLIALIYLAFVPIMVSAVKAGIKIRKESGENQQFFEDPDPKHRQSLLGGGKADLGKIQGGK
ncbi:hypothetical protein [Arcanobacterium ihumii]|uniref:hypothetical protein n=1 Tax=Arcanobacterium ihumii TaxID=2138162 RepID=UPI000F536A59|nr:hypothetical protein [Arcanobacterium ihumii]